jgi:tetratricopeptide (TPR) repeat protein
LAIREKALGPEHPDTANSMNNLAFLLDAQGKPAEAEPLCQRALAIYEKALGPEHPYTVVVRNNLIQFYRKQGRNAEADALEKGA